MFTIGSSSGQTYNVRGPQTPAPAGGASAPPQPAATTPYAGQPAPFNAYGDAQFVGKTKNNAPVLQGAPDKAYQDFFVPGAQRARYLLENQQGFLPVDMPALADLNATLSGALGQQQALAEQGMGQQVADAGLSQIGALTGNMGLAAGSQPALDVMRGIATGQNQIQTGAGFGNIAANPLSSAQMGAQGFYQGAQTGQNLDALNAVNQAAQGPTASSTNLQGMATGGQGQDYLDQLESLINDRIVAQSRADASRRGRVGSSYEAQNVADAISRNILSGRLQQFNADREAQLRANQQIDAADQSLLGLRRALAGDITGAQFRGADSSAAIGQQGIQNVLAGLQGQTQVQGANIANQGNTAQAEAALRQGAVSDFLRSQALAPELVNARYADAGRLQQIGDFFQQREQAQLEQDRADAYDRQQAPFNQLAAYFQNINGLSQPASVGANANAVAQQNALAQQQFQASQPSGLLQAIGGVGLGLGALNQSGLLAPIGNGIKTVGQGLLGALF